MNLHQLDKTNFDDVFEKNDIVVLDFWAEWCGPCKSFAPTFEAVASEFPKVAFGKIDIEAAPELAEEFNIRSVPTLMIIRDAIVVSAEAGVMPKSALVDLIEQAQALNMDEVRASIEESDET